MNEMKTAKKKASAKTAFKFKDLNSKKSPKGGCHAFQGTIGMDKT